MKNKKIYNGQRTRKYITFERDEAKVAKDREKKLL